jgi:ubiquinone/menaquinone biosynthesis C-methylase UbiE
MKNRKRLATALVATAVLALLGWILRDWIAARFYLQILETEQRIERLQIPRVLGVLAVQPGQRVADVGAGTGVFTRPLAEAVGNAGVVYAIDINPQLLDHIERTTDGLGLGKVQTVLAEPDDPLIPEPVDLILVCDTLHHIGDRKRYVQTAPR